MTRLRWLLVPCFGVLLGCGDDDPELAPAPPPTMRADAGNSSGNDDEDASVDDAGSDDGGTPVLAVQRNECENIDLLAAQNDDLPFDERPSYLELPLTFAATRAVGAWDVESCESPRFTITLSEGKCPNGRGQEWRLSLSQAAIDSGKIAIGDNTLTPDADNSSISVRYRSDAKSGEYGTCAGVTGIVTFLDDPELERGGAIAARFQMDLTDCTGAGRPAKTFAGSFNVRVRRSFAEVCN